MHRKIFLNDVIIFNYFALTSKFIVIVIYM